MSKLLFSLVMLVSLSACNTRGLDEAKQAAPAAWKANGFEVVGYEGYMYSIKGAEVWHSLRKIPDNGISYTGYVMMWNDEPHIYGPIAIDIPLAKKH